MSGRRSLIKGYFGVARVVGAVMSSAFRGRLDPLALMLSADPFAPITAARFNCADTATGFGINPLCLSDHLLVTLDSLAAALLASLGCELWRRSYAAISR
jgi:hypothetical protein